MCQIVLLYGGRATYLPPLPAVFLLPVIFMYRLEAEYFHEDG